MIKVIWSRSVLSKLMSTLLPWMKLSLQSEFRKTAKMFKQSQSLQIMTIQQFVQYKPLIEFFSELKDLAKQMTNQWQFLLTAKAKPNILLGAKLLNSYNHWQKQPILTWHQMKYHASLLTLGESRLLFFLTKQVNHQISSNLDCITWEIPIASICKTTLLFNTNTYKLSQQILSWLLGTNHSTLQDIVPIDYDMGIYDDNDPLEKGH